VLPCGLHPSPRPPSLISGKGELLAALFTARDETGHIVAAQNLAPLIKGRLPFASKM